MRRPISSRVAEFAAEELREAGDDLESAVGYEALSRMGLIFGSLEASWPTTSC